MSSSRKVLSKSQSPRHRLSWKSTAKKITHPFKHIHEKSHPEVAASNQSSETSDETEVTLVMPGDLKRSRSAPEKKSDGEISLRRGRAASALHSNAKARLWSPGRTPRNTSNVIHATAVNGQDSPVTPRSSPSSKWLDQHEDDSASAPADALSSSENVSLTESETSETVDQFGRPFDDIQLKNQRIFASSHSGTSSTPSWLRDDSTSCSVNNFSPEAVLEANQWIKKQDIDLFNARNLMFFKTYFPQHPLSQFIDTIEHEEKSIDDSSATKSTERINTNII